jgi:hypothetical protein
MHPCVHSSKKATQINQRGKEVLLREDSLVVMRKGTRFFFDSKKGHKIEACTNRVKVPLEKPGGTGFAKLVAPVSPRKLHMKLNKGFLKAQGKFIEKNGSVTSVKGNGNIKHKICYTCRKKGTSW